MVVIRSISLISLQEVYEHLDPQARFIGSDIGVPEEFGISQLSLVFSALGSSWRALVVWDSRFPGCG